jgi:hypothetical protein
MLVMARCTAFVCFLAAIGQVGAFWREECPPGPPDYVLPDNKELDCSIRSLAYEYSISVLGKGRRGQSRIHQALNLALCNVSFDVEQQHIPDREAVLQQLRANEAHGSPLEIFVSPSGSDVDGDGSEEKPFQSIPRAQTAARGAAKTNAVVVWLRAGSYFNSNLNFTAQDAGYSATMPTIYAGFPGEEAIVSGGVPLDASKLEWEKPPGDKETTASIFRAKLPPNFNAGMAFTGLFWNGSRLTRARYPNCADITGTDCYRLNASGPTGHINTPLHKLPPSELNLNVINQHGVDMFADKYDNAKSDGPHGASDNTLPAGKNLTLTVTHPDYAWRCHEDCGWVAYSKWRGNICGAEPKAGVMGSTRGSYWDPDACRMDPTFNEPYWTQQVSGGFYFNATAPATPWAPAWTTKRWDPEGVKGGVVHMYHTARWGGWQYRLHSRNDTDNSLLFQCNILNVSSDDGVPTVLQRGVACPKEGDNAGKAALVLGGWQEGRGADIGHRVTRNGKHLNNSYFVENILEELDYPGEWYLAHPAVAGAGAAGATAADSYLYIALPKGVAKPTDLGTLVATAHQRVVSVTGSASSPVRDVHFENLTIAHSAYTYLSNYETPSGGDWLVDYLSMDLLLI